MRPSTDIRSAIASCTDPRELRIAIGLADVRLQQLALSQQMDDATLDARASVVGHFLRAGRYCAELERRYCAPRPDDVGLVGSFFCGVFLGALITALLHIAGLA